MADKPLQMSVPIMGQSVTANANGVFEPRPIKVTDDGEVLVSVEIAPAEGGATETTLLNVLTKLGSILTSLQGTLAVLGTVAVSNFPATQPISAAALPLPSGAATDTKQDTGNTSLASIDGKLSKVAALPATNADGTVVRLVPPERTSGDVTLAALNDTCTVEGTGFTSIGGSVGVGTFTGTLSFQASTDGGVTYGTVVVNGPSGTQIISLAQTNPNTGGGIEFFSAGQYTHYRIKVTAYTSGSCVARLRASMTASAFGVGGLNASLVGSAASFYVGVMGGRDGSSVARALTVMNSAPVGTEYAGVVREVQLSQSAAGGYVRQDSNATMAKETGGNLATAVTTLDSLLTELTAKTEPDDTQLSGALVNDRPQSYFDGDTQPMSLTNEGRLRVSAVVDIDRAWQHTDDSPWPQDDSWEMRNAYV